jgi:hypothetical protein
MAGAANCPLTGKPCEEGDNCPVPACVLEAREREAEQTAAARKLAAYQAEQRRLFLRRDPKTARREWWVRNVVTDQPERPATFEDLGL